MRMLVKSTHSQKLFVTDGSQSVLQEPVDMYSCKWSPARESFNEYPELIKGHVNIPEEKRSWRQTNDVRRIDVNASLSWDDIIKSNTIIPSFEIMNGPPPPRSSKSSHQPSDVPTCFCFSIALDKTNNNNRIIVISPVEDWNELVAELRLHTVTLCWFGILCYVCGETALGPVCPLVLEYSGALFPSAGRVRTDTLRDASKSVRELKRNIRDDKSPLCQYPHPCVLFKKSQRNPMA